MVSSTDATLRNLSRGNKRAIHKTYRQAQVDRLRLWACNPCQTSERMQARPDEETALATAIAAQPTRGK